MKLFKVADLEMGKDLQDGAIFGNYLFRLHANGHLFVFDVSALGNSDDVISIHLIGDYQIPFTDGVVPHSNTAVFSTEYYDESDEFPLLYLNVYNNYQKNEDKHEGECLVYRILREGSAFSLKLVQILKIGFVNEGELWRSAPDYTDIRPYGNFVIDNEKNELHVFTMRDKDKTTRFFSFSLPSVFEGEMDENGVRHFILKKKDILSCFDTEYFHFVQGACFRRGRIYSTEGFNASIHPQIRVVDIEQQRLIQTQDLFEIGLPDEAEFIDFKDGVCYYGDAKAQIFRVEF